MNNLPPNTEASVFFDAVTNKAILVANRKGRRKSQPISFPDAHTALAWCITQRARFIYLPEAKRAGE